MIERWFNSAAFSVFSVILPFLALALLTEAACAQNMGAPDFNDVSNQTQTPIPGAGHDYQHLLGETVNFSNGSVNFKLSFPVAKSRGITLPYVWSYNSSSVNPLNMIDGNQPAWDAYWTQSGPTVDGWNTMEGIPYGSVAIWSYAPPANSQQAKMFAACNVQSGMTFTDSSGVMHNLYVSAQATSATGTNYQQVCGTQLYVPPGGDSQVVAVPDPNTATNDLAGTAPQSGNFVVTDKSGTVYSFRGGITPQNGAVALPVGSIEDKNGNVISFPGNNNALYTDTAGRQGPTINSTQTIVYSTPSSSQNFYFPTSFTVGDITYTAAWKTVNVNYTITLGGEGSGGNCRFNIPTTVSGTRMVLSSLTLPNGKQYTFQYNNSYGLISEITYPDGGSVQYTWELPSILNETAFWGGFLTETAQDGSLYYLPESFGCQATYQTPALASRTVSFGGGPVQTQTFSYNTNWEYASDGTVNDWSQKTTTVSTTDEIAGLISSTKYTYAPYVVPKQLYASGIAGPAIPLESEIDYYDWGQSTPVKTVNKTWADQFDMTSETTTINATGKVSGTVYIYGSAPLTAPTAAYSFTYLLERDDYDYGNGPLPVPATLNPPFPGTSSSRHPTKITFYNYTCCESLPTNIYSTYTSTYSLLGVAVPVTVPLTVPPQLASETVEDGASGAIVAVTQHGYDGSTLSSVSATQHDASYGTGMTARGNLTSVTRCLVPSANCTTGPTTTYTYDITGQPTSMTDPCGNAPCGDMSGSNHITTFNFADIPSGGNGNSNAYLTNITYPQVNGIILQKNFQYNYITGYLTRSKDENGQTTTYQYDTILDRPTEIDFPDHGETTYSYNDPGLSVTTSKLIEADLWEVSTAYRDGMFHTIKTQMSSDPDGTDTVDTIYDGEGRARTVSNPYRSSPGGTITYYYDALGRQIETQEQDGSVQQWCYDGVASTPAVYCSSSQLGSSNSGTWVDFTDENGNHWERGDNVFGDLTKVMEPNGTTQNSTMETDYAYDVLNNLTAVTQLGGASGSSGARTRNFSYDGLSRLGMAYNPETGTVSYTYDANSNVSSKTDARTVKTSYFYDALNRLLSKSYSDGTTPLSCYQYDLSSAACSQASPNSAGRLTNTWTQSVSTASTCSTSASFLTRRSISCYDAMGRILNEQQYTPASQTSGTSYTPSYSYDLAGNLQTSTSGVGPTPTATPLLFTFIPNGADRLQTVMSSLSSNTISGTAYTYPTTLFSPSSTSQSSICANSTSPTPQYSAFGGLMNAAYGSGLTLNRAYDNRLRTTCESDAGTPQSIVAASQTINFTALTTPVTYGIAPIILSASASSGLPVTFSVLSGPATVSGDTLTITGAGTVVVAADQAGNANYTAAAEATQSIVVSPAYDSAIQLQFTSTQLVYPGATSMVVCVSPAASATATGSVNIYDGTTLLTTQGLGGNGCAYWYISPGLSAGSHAITAAYSGDSNNPSGTSAPTTLAVSTVPVNMSVSCWNASFAYGGNYQCTVNLSSNAGAPQGSLTYSLDSGSATTVPLSGGSAQFTITTPSAGSHQIVVGYAQQTNYAASTPQTESFTVTGAPVNVSLTPSTWYASTGTNISFTAAITSWSAGAPNASGTVSFYDGSNLLSTVPVNASGQATFATASLTTGSHTITAAYTGGNNYANGSSNVTITLAAGN